MVARSHQSHRRRRRSTAASCFRRPGTAAAPTRDRQELEPLGCDLVVPLVVGDVGGDDRAADERRQRLAAHVVVGLGEVGRDEVKGAVGAAVAGEGAVGAGDGDAVELAQAGACGRARRSEVGGRLLLSRRMHVPRVAPAPRELLRARARRGGQLGAAPTKVGEEVGDGLPVVARRNHLGQRAAASEVGLQRWAADRQPIPSPTLKPAGGRTRRRAHAP
jgi:hypothetical protein